LRAGGATHRVALLQPARPPGQTKRRYVGSCSEELGRRLCGDQHDLHRYRGRDNKKLTGLESTECRADDLYFMAPMIGMRFPMWRIPRTLKDGAEHETLC